MTMILADLLAYLFDGKPHLLTGPMSTWMTSSRRFTAFVNTNHTKIRKKLRSADDPETLSDLQLELETAYMLLRERSLSLAYEPQHRELGRSPDFAVSFTTSFTFMVEVTRLRSTRINSPTEQPQGDRFSDMVLSKLGQLLPQIANLLIVGMGTPRLTLSELNTIMVRIQRRAEGANPAIMQRYGFRDRADFFRRYQRLSAIILRAIPLQIDETVVAWVNPQAKYPLPARVNTALQRCHAH